MNETDRPCRRQKVNGGVQGGYVVLRIMAGWGRGVAPPRVPEGVELPNGRRLNSYRLMHQGRQPVVARMLRYGYILQKTYRFLPITTDLAQVLHCVRESDACPIRSCADADSRRVALR